MCCICLLALIKKILITTGLTKGWRDMLKKAELDIKELETLLKLYSGILGLHIPTLNVRARYMLEAVWGAGYRGFGNQTWV